MKLVDLHVLLVCFFFVVTCSGSKLICFFLGRICFRSVITWLHPKPMLGFPERHMCPFRNLVGSSFTLFAQEHMPFAFGAAQDGRDLGGNPRPLVVRRRYPSTPATEDPASSARCRSSCVLEAETHDGRQVELLHPEAIKNACGASAAGPPHAGASKNGYGASAATSPSGDSARRCDPARRRSLSFQRRRSRRRARR